LFRCVVWWLEATASVNLAASIFNPVNGGSNPENHEFHLHRYEKFVDSPYYSESEFCRGAVTVSFSKYLSWQAIHFLQHSIHFSKTRCRPFVASFRRIVEQAILTFHVRFSVSETLPPLENRSSSHYIVSIGLMDEL
jgi:hypothetical protein